MKVKDLHKIMKKIRKRGRWKEERKEKKNRRNKERKLLMPLSTIQEVQLIKLMYVQKTSNMELTPTEVFFIIRIKIVIFQM